MKILLLVVIGSAGVLYAAVQLGISPLLAARRAKSDRIAELTDAIELARSKTGQLRILKEQNRKVISELIGVSDKYVLRRRLGNLQLGASEAVERYAADADVEIMPLREIGIADIPRVGGGRGRAAPSADASFRVYAAQVDIVGGLHDTVDFLKVLESANPYLCVSSVNVEAQPGDPAVHKMWIEIQWPVWADPSVRDNMAGQLEEMQGAENGAKADTSL